MNPPPAPLSKSQLACQAALHWEEYQGRQGGDRKSEPLPASGDTRSILAKRFGVSHGYVDVARRFMLTDSERFGRIAAGLEPLPRSFSHSLPSGPCAYVFRMDDTDCYKIGKTDSDVEGRLASCQTGNPYKLTIVLVLPTEEPGKLESALHRKFASQRMEGEWFRLSDADLAALASR